MAKFNVTFTRTFEETGTLSVEADDEDEARDIATGLMLDNDYAISWSEQTLEEQIIDGIEES